MADEAGAAAAAVRLRCSATLRAGGALPLPQVLLDGGAAVRGLLERVVRNASRDAAPAGTAYLAASVQGRRAYAVCCSPAAAAAAAATTLAEKLTVVLAHHSFTA